LQLSSRDADIGFIFRDSAGAVASQMSACFLQAENHLRQTYARNNLSYYVIRPGGLSNKEGGVAGVLLDQVNPSLYLSVFSPHVPCGVQFQSYLAGLKGAPTNGLCTWFLLLVYSTSTSVESFFALVAQKFGRGASSPIQVKWSHSRVLPRLFSFLLVGFLTNGPQSKLRGWRFSGPFDEDPYVAFNQARFPLLLKVSYRILEIEHLMHSRLAVQDLAPHLTAPTLTSKRRADAAPWQQSWNPRERFFENQRLESLIAVVIAFP
jgi:hypothetical protein